MKTIYTLLLVLLTCTAHGQSKLPECSFLSNLFSQKNNCFDSVTRINDKEGWKYTYDGEWKNDQWEGQGTYTQYSYDNGSSTQSYKYTGEFKNGKYHGRGTYLNSEGGFYKIEGIWENDEIVQCDKVEINKNYALPNSFSKCNYLLRDSLKNTFEEQRNLKIENKIFDDANALPSVTFKSALPSCSGKDAKQWTNCQGVHNYTNGDRYEGEFKDGKPNGSGKYYHLSNNQYRGDKYIGQFLNGYRQGSGRYTSAKGDTLEGIWNAGVFVRAERVNLQASMDFTLLEERRRIEEEKLRLADERREIEEVRKRRETAKANTGIDLRITVSEPDPNGLVLLLIQTGVDTSSLKINGDEQGGNEKGFYQIKRLPKVGQDTTYSVVAVDGYGNAVNKSIVVQGQRVATSKVVTTLNPEILKKSVSRDAVAIIVGIQDYKRLPKADFANDDARSFYDYAVRALGIKPENIKMLIDSEAEQVEILSAFKSWLPAYVKKDKTDLYVFYSGHGLPSVDGKSLFFLPQNGHKDFLSETGIDQNSLVAAISAAKPKSVTMFIDSCYSGNTRTGETLLSSARPIALKASENIFPNNYTVITASSLDQISSSSLELKHGIFSFYLMKGLEGGADLNNDGKITAGELQSYLSDAVPRQAMSMNRKQEPQLIGDPDRVLVIR